MLGRECSSLPAAKGQSWFAAALWQRCKAQENPSREVCTQPGKSVLKKTQKDFTPCAKPLFFRSTMGQIACYIRAINFYAVWPLGDRSPFKQGSWMQIIISFSRLRDFSQNVSYVSYIIMCTTCNHKSMLLPKLHLSPTAQNLSAVHAWWQFHCMW